MRKMLVIASREYQAAVRSKAFIISMVTMPVLMCGSILLQMVLKDAGGKKERHFAVIDRTPGGKFLPLIQGQIGKQDQTFKIKDADYIAFNEKGQQTIEQKRLQLSQRIEKGDLYGFVEIGAGVYPSVKAIFPPAGNNADRWGIRYQTNNPINDDFSHWVTRLVNEEVQKQRCRLTKVDCDQVKQITAAIPLKLMSLTEETGAGKIKDAPAQNRMAAFFVPFGLMMLMFMVLMIGATPLMQGIVEEKMQRIAEVLLGSVGPFELMMGKLLGMVGVSLTLVAVYLGGGYWALHHFNLADLLPVKLLLWFLVFQVLSLLMYGSLFIAIGAACTDAKETQTMLMPVMLLACLPMFLMGNILQNPHGTFAESVSFFPFATPMLMIVRQAIPPPIPLWQPILGATLVLLTTLACVYAAGRIFRVGILMQGKGAKFSDLIRWVFRG